MAFLLTIDVDTAALLAAIDAIPDAVLEHTKAAAKVTADNIVKEARSRVARATGRTAVGIVAVESYDKSGYVVLPHDVAHRLALIGAGNDDQPLNLPLWLEFGTKHMTARPYFFTSARLEEGSHDRRMRDAIRDAIAEQGLGDA